jgi:hypothetical protein
MFSGNEKLPQRRSSTSLNRNAARDNRLSNAAHNLLQAQRKLTPTKKR